MLLLTNPHIIRVRKISDYTVIANYPVNDARLSTEALGMLVYILSKPDNWIIMNDELQKRFRLGRKKFDRILAELKTAGYVQRQRGRANDGSFYYETVIREVPLSLKGTTENDIITVVPLSVNGSAVNGSAVNGKRDNIVSTESPSTESVNTESINTECESRAPKKLSRPEKILAENKKIAIRLTEICGYKSPEFVTGKRLAELSESVATLLKWQVTTEQLDLFGRWWWGKNPPTPRQVVEEWGKFLNAQAAGEKPINGYKPHLTPEQVAAARQLNLESEQALAESRDRIDQIVAASCANGIVQAELKRLAKKTKR